VPRREDDDLNWQDRTELCDLIRRLAAGRGHDKYDDYQILSRFDDEAFSLIAGEQMTQPLVSGDESRSVESYLAASLVAAIRDFTDTNTGVDAACDGVRVAAEIGRKSKGLRKAMRRQIRRTLDAPIWAERRSDNVPWQCPFCGVSVFDDGEGFPRRLRLNESHPKALPARDDVGCASTWNRGLVRGHMLLLLAALLRPDSWPKHRRYFVGMRAFAALEDHFSRENAGGLPFDRCLEMLH
jgi:hypothetical protein